MTEVVAGTGVASDGAGGDQPVERAFLIADIRGWTRFTRERGDAEAARLAKRFADLSRDTVEARGGRVVELRGDEAMATFESPVQAVRAATELVAACAEEVAADPDLPLLVGIGIDVGEAVPVEDGFRGAALNTAARLCSQAAAWQVLVTSGLAERAGELDGVRFTHAGSAELKGFEAPVAMIEVVAEERARPAACEGPLEPPPAELEPDTPIVGRERELAWLRGTWRQARRGYGRVLFVSGPGQIGKSRLASELAAYVAVEAPVLYAGAGGTAAALAASALREAVADPRPALVVLDDLDVTGEIVVPLLDELFDRIEAGPTLVVALVRDQEASSALARLVERADTAGDGHRRLGPLDSAGVREVARLYAGGDVADAPLESIARASAGVPGRVHELMSEWAGQEATRRLAAAAEWLASGRRERTVDLEFANNVIALKLGRLYDDGRHTAGAAGLACPYKGLAPFDDADAEFFFGRERLVGELAARTVGAGLLAVVGASGCGKSSAIAAGLVPSLRAGLLPGSDRWRSAAMRPGERPLTELESLRSSTADADGRLVLVVDQFEEVFTVCHDDQERSGFIESVVELAADPDQTVVVIGIRGDFYGRLGSYPELARLVAANQVVVGPMSADELRRAIELPARRAGVRVESALAGALASEIIDEPGGLPLLSTALVELWVSHSDRWLRLEAHERLGGVRGAVARLAESSYEQLSDEQRSAARRLFLRLVTTGDEGVLARRGVPRSELDLERDAPLASVVERLTGDRLLTAHEDTIEVAHEALIRECRGSRSGSPRMRRAGSSANT